MQASFQYYHMTLVDYVRGSSHSFNWAKPSGFTTEQWSQYHTTDYVALGTAKAQVDFRYKNSANVGTFSGYAQINCTDTGKISTKISNSFNL